MLPSNRHYILVFVKVYFTTLYIMISANHVVEEFIPNTCAQFLTDHVIHKSSYWQCLKLCKNNIECKAVSYMQKGLRCHVHRHDNETVECQGHVFSKKSDWIQAHSVKTHRGFPVEIQETEHCPGISNPVHGQWLGNKIDVGDKKLLFCNKGYLPNQARENQCTNGGLWNGQNATCIEDPNCNQHLVTGPNGVSDDQLTESSYWCKPRPTESHCPDVPKSLSAIYARLNSTGIPSGAWAGYHRTRAEYVQVDFLRGKVFAAVVLTGRHNINQFLTKFTVKTSQDCVNFVDVLDDSGNLKVFDGVTDTAMVVIRKLTVRLFVRCIRIHPHTWSGHPSLRFDIEGCPYRYN